jgi:hypothetical protein
MTRQRPGNGHSALTAYEQRQLELIEEGLAIEVPEPARRGDRDAAVMSESMWLWLAVYWTWIILGGWYHLAGSSVGGVVILIGLVGTAAVLSRQGWRRVQARLQR